jgi:hypothetical protein
MNLVKKGAQRQTEDDEEIVLGAESMVRSFAIPSLFERSIARLRDAWNRLCTHRTQPV